MNRRAVLRELAIITGGVVLLPTCNHLSETEVLAAYDNLNISEKENELVRMLCEVILPASDGIKGANDLMIEDFVMVMVNDCLDQEKQESFINGLKALGPCSSRVLGKTLNKLTKEEWKDFILEVSKIEDKVAVVKSLEWNTLKDVQYFLNIVKQFTIQGFITSEYFMTEIMPYSMAPGKFQGKVLIKEGEKVNIYG